MSSIQKKYLEYPNNIIKAITEKITLIENRLKQQLNIKTTIKPITLSKEQAEQILNLLIPRLPIKQQIIIIETFKNNKKLEEIANQLNLSKERVRQLTNVAIRNLCDGPQAMLFIYGYEKGLKQISAQKSAIENKSVDTNIFKKHDWETLQMPDKISNKEFINSKKFFLQRAINKTQKNRIEKYCSDYEKILREYSY